MSPQVTQDWLFKTVEGRFLKNFSTVYCITTNLPEQAYQVKGTKDYADGVAFMLSKLCTPVTSFPFNKAVKNYKKSKL